MTRGRARLPEAATMARAVVMRTDSDPLVTLTSARERGQRSTLGTPPVGGEEGKAASRFTYFLHLVSTGLWIVGKVALIIVCLLLFTPPPVIQCVINHCRSFHSVLLVAEISAARLE